MLRFLQNAEIDKNKWNNCIDNSVNSLLYAYSWYLDIIAEGWQAYVEDDYNSVFPIFPKNKFGITYLSQPPFMQQGGLFFTDDKSNNLLPYYIKQLKNDFKFIEINLNKYNVLKPALNNSKSYFIKNRNFELDLKNNYNQLYNKYCNNTKRNLNRAKSNNLICRNINEINDIITLFKENKGKEINAFQNSQFDILKSLYNECFNKNIASVWTVSDTNNKLLAGAFFIETKNHSIFLFSGQNKEGREKRAMFFLIDNYIKIHSASNLLLDFEGSNNDNLARFYSGFNSSETNYYSFHFNNLSLLLKPFFKLYKKIKV
ncbi:MAG: hypothetical protein KA792_09370 [Bacteroidales bacterium]|nr:hypothetical protein [Bacteroidales bacterium]